MFDKQYRFRGRHAVRVDKLTGVFDTNSKAKHYLSAMSMCMPMHP